MKRTKLLLLTFIISLSSLYVFGQEKPVESPHSQALMHVLTTQQDIIRKIDENNLKGDVNDWWHDVEERRWIVKRPFYPGLVDSTHMFSVDYIINEKTVAQWSVDINYNTVELAEKEANR